MLFQKSAVLYPSIRNDLLKSLFDVFEILVNVLEVDFDLGFMFLPEPVFLFEGDLFLRGLE